MVLGIGSVLSALTALVYDRASPENDVIDTFNHMVISALLTCLAVAAASRQYVGTAIYCWAPAEFSQKYHRRYINHYCWVNVVYNVPFDEPVPALEEDRYFNDVTFYKLAAVLFLLLAALFRLPNLLWKSMKPVYGPNTEQLVGLVTDCASMEQDQKEEQLDRVGQLFIKWISIRQLSSRNGKHDSLMNNLATASCTRCSGCRLVMSFLLVKFLYVINVVGQFFIISAFLQTNFWSFGTAAAISYAKLGQWEDTYNFPRVAQCDVKIRQMDSVHTHTVQCVLAINAFLEKMFLLLWICLMMMLVANVLSCIRWLVELCHAPRTERFLRKYFGRLMADRPDSYHMIARLSAYLQADGVLVLRMVAKHNTDMLTSDLAKHIWAKYSRSQDPEAMEDEEAEERKNNKVTSAV